MGVNVRPPLGHNIAYHGARDPSGGSGQDSFTASVANVDKSAMLCRTVSKLSTLFADHGGRSGRGDVQEPLEFLHGMRIRRFGA
jgi:hypothetical protein